MYVKLVCAKCDNEFAINTTHLILENTGDFKLTKIWSLSYPTGKELF